MEVTVKLNYLRIAPRKVRRVVNLVRGKKTDEAEAILKFLPNKPAKSILKLLKSGIAAAKHDFELDQNNLYISKIFVNEGPKLKRFIPVSRGSAHPLWKRTSHIVLVLDEIKGSTKNVVTKKENKKGKVEKAAKLKDVNIVSKSAISEKKEKSRFEKREEKSLPRAKIQEKSKEFGRFKKIFRRKAI